MIHLPLFFVLQSFFLVPQSACHVSFDGALDTEDGHAVSAADSFTLDDSMSSGLLAPYLTTSSQVPPVFFFSFCAASFASSAEICQLCLALVFQY